MTTYKDFAGFNPRLDVIEDVIEQLKRDQRLDRRDNHTHFNMNAWVDILPEAADEQDKWPTICNTACCLAGTAVVIRTPPEKLFVFKFGGWQLTDINFELEGGKLFGIKPFEAARLLFILHNWPERYLNRRRLDTTNAIHLLTDMLNGDLVIKRAYCYTGQTWNLKVRRYVDQRHYVYSWFYKGEQVW